MPYFYKCKLISIKLAEITSRDMRDSQSKDQRMNLVTAVQFLADTV